MPNRDPHLHSLLSGLKTPPLPDSFVVRLKAVADQPQARGLRVHSGVFEDLSFGLRHDLRYQLATACAALVLSIGAWQGLRPGTAPHLPATAESEAATALMDVDPVLAGGL